MFKHSKLIVFWDKKLRKSKKVKILRQKDSVSYKTSAY